MKNLTERLNFSNKKLNDCSIELKKGLSQADYYDALCQYYSENDISMSNSSLDEFIDASYILVDFGSNDLSSDSFFLSIDA